MTVADCVDVGTRVVLRPNRWSRLGAVLWTLVVWSFLAHALLYRVAPPPVAPARFWVWLILAAFFALLGPMFIVEMFCYRVTIEGDRFKAWSLFGSLEAPAREVAVELHPRRWNRRGGAAFRHGRRSFFVRGDFEGFPEDVSRNRL